MGPPRPIRGQESGWFLARPDILGRALGSGRQRLINLGSLDRGNIKIDPDRFASNSTNYLIDSVLGIGSLIFRSSQPSSFMTD